MRKLALALVWAAVGCLDAPGAPPAPDAAVPDAGPAGAPVVLDLEVVDGRGAAASRRASPRRPRIRIRLDRPVGGEPEPAALLAVEPSGEVAADLARPPLRAALEARRVPCEVTRAGAVVSLSPHAPLTPGGVYTVAVGGWAADEAGVALEQPFVAELVVADPAGAVLTDTWPADGTAGVPATLPVLGARFDDVVTGAEGGVSLDEVGGDAVPCLVRQVPCPTLGWPDGACVSLTPERELSPARAHRVSVSNAVLDRHGAAVGPVHAEFTTGEGNAGAPAFAPRPCALDESVVVAGCALATDEVVELAVATSGPARLWLEGAERVDSAVAPRGTARLRLAGLPSDRALAATLRVVGLDGSTRTEELSLATTPPLPRVSIVEVRPDPRGPEPAQEYVEILNLGEAPVPLEGFRLTDRADAEGDALPAHTLAPGARALVVPDRFDARHPDDAPVPPGTPLLRIGTSLGSGGVANAGEALFLRDAAGRRLSATPASPRAAPGVCVVRVSADPRSGARGSFARDPDGTCTPGRAPRTAP